MQLRVQCLAAAKRQSLAAHGIWPGGPLSPL